MTRDVVAIVLAGGRSSRFGSDKLASTLEGRPLLDHAILAAASVASTVLVVAAPTGTPSLPAAPDGVELRLVRDAAPFEGPLAGVATGLAAAVRATGTVPTAAVIVAGDMPTLRPAVLRAMLDRLTASPDVDAVLLETGGLHRPLPAVVHTATGLAAANAALGSGTRSLLGWLDRLACASLPEREWRALDPAGDTLADVDRPGELRDVAFRRARPVPGEPDGAGEALDAGEVREAGGAGEARNEETPP